MVAPLDVITLLFVGAAKLRNQQPCEAMLDAWASHLRDCLAVMMSEVRVSEYEAGDFVKVEFEADASGVGERMWVRVRSCDDQRRLVFGTLDSVPLNDYGDRLKLGTEVAVDFDRIVQHKKSSEFDSGGRAGSDRRPSRER